MADPPYESAEAKELGEKKARQKEAKRLRDKGRDRSGRVQDRSGRVQKRPGRVQKQPGRKRWLSSLTYSDLIEALDAA